MKKHKYTEIHTPFYARYLSHISLGMIHVQFGSDICHLCQIYLGIDNVNNYIKKKAKFYCVLIMCTFILQCKLVHHLY